MDTGVKSRLYNIWSDMRQRCKNDGKPCHDNWGNRGITVCEEWNDYETFRTWALANGYSEELTIDRVNNNGNYEPDNCRWATYKQQANNQRTNRLVEINGEIHTVTEWCEILGNVTQPTVYRRMRMEGWDIKKALLHPSQKTKSLHPEKTDALYKKRRKPLIAFNDTESIYFASGSEAEKQGHCRGAIRKARLKGIKHHGYYWRFADE